jgi:hypothetical protein
VSHVVHDGSTEVPEHKFKLDGTVCDREEAGSAHMCTSSVLAADLQVQEGGRGGGWTLGTSIPCAHQHTLSFQGRRKMLPSPANLCGDERSGQGIGSRL